MNVIIYIFSHKEFNAYTNSPACMVQSAGNIFPCSNEGNRKDWSWVGSKQHCNTYLIMRYILKWVLKSFHFELRCFHVYSMHVRLEMSKAQEYKIECEIKMMELWLRRGNLIKEEVARHLSHSYHEVKKNLSTFFLCPH